jgi:chromosome segregation ATPase
MNRIARTSVALAALACLCGMSGCSAINSYLSSPVERVAKGPAKPRKEAIVLKAPRVDSSKNRDQQPTLLEQLTKLTRRLEKEQVRVDELQTSLASEKDLRQKSEAKTEELARKLRFLREQEAELTRISKEYDTAQQELKGLVNKVRSQNQTMHKEELKNVRLQQQLVTLKIEMARLNRRQLLNRPALKKQVPSTQPPMTKTKEVAKP